MIDIEAMVLSRVSAAVKEKYPDAYCYGEYVAAPTSFPCVCLVETSNRTHKKTLDDSLKEHHAELTYEVNVYSNLASGKKGEAKEITDIIDDVLQNLKFTRTFREQTPNVDRTIYRITARYTVIVAEGTTINGNTVYQMYRN